MREHQQALGERADRKSTCFGDKVERKHLCIRVINIEPAALGSSADRLICFTHELDIVNGTGYRTFLALSYHPLRYHAQPPQPLRPEGDDHHGRRLQRAHRYYSAPIICKICRVGQRRPRVRLYQGLRGMAGCAPRPQPGVEAPTI